MSGSCHLDKASNVEISVECQIFVIVIVFNCGQVLQFGAYSRYYKDAIAQKRSFLVICTTLRSQIEGYTRLLIFSKFSILPAVI